MSPVGLFSFPVFLLSLNVLVTPFAAVSMLSRR
jgi:hypothetical protein